MAHHLLLCVVLLGCLCHVISQFCIQTSNSGDSLPGLPNKFQTEIEASFLNKKYTMSIKEYYDGYKDRGAVVEIVGGKVLRVIYDYKDNEIFFIADGKCSVGNLSLIANKMLAGHENPLSPLPVFTTHDGLRIVSDFGKTFINTTFKRGIAVHHWHSCAYVSYLKANLTIDYYFADSSWKTASGTPGRPVEFEIKGVYDSKGKMIPFHNIYSYHSFSSDIPEDAFQIPKHIFCPGRKNKKSLPKMPRFFSYREEIIFENQVKPTQVWYDHDKRLMRYDYHPTTIEPPAYSDFPMTEVHDFNVGVRYLINKDFQNCSVLPLLSSGIDVVQNLTVYHINNMYVLHLRNAMQFFYLDDTFIFMGQKTVRYIECDVFATKKINYPLSSGDIINATLEYYFLSSDWQEVSLEGMDSTTAIPIMLEISTDDNSYNSVHNFMDFSDEEPDPAVFEISKCYAEKSKLFIKVRLPGIYYPETLNHLKKEAAALLADKMGIYQTRIQDVTLDYDSQNIFILASVLDRAPPTAQFTHIKGKEIEKADDKVIPNMYNATICAFNCINSDSFVCNSFDLCPTDKSCRLSKSHIGDGNANLKDSKCDHYSRNIDGPQIQEISIEDAFDNLQEQIYGGVFVLSAPNPIGDDMVKYVAVTVELTYGALDKVAMPSLPDNFYYRQEISIPTYNTLDAANVWFDAKRKLVRFDYYDEFPSSPFFTSDEMTTIHDFNSGVSYHIDWNIGNCTIAPMKSGSFDMKQNISSQIKDNTQVLQLKDPRSLFYIDNTYKYAGQKTVRGVLCNVFESVRTDFIVPGTASPSLTLFQYYFMSTKWYVEEIDTSHLMQLLPIGLDVSSAPSEYFATYNFFDFNDWNYGIWAFNIRRCFDSNAGFRFQVTFPGRFHPYLETVYDNFIASIENQVSNLTGISQIQLQSPVVDHDSENVYYTAFLLPSAPAKAHFTEYINKVNGRSGDKTYRNVTNADDCAVFCMAESSFTCNSFDVCPKLNRCTLSKLYTDDGSQLSNKPSCSHYSRSVKGSQKKVTPSLIAIGKLKDAILDGLLVVNITADDGTVVLYKATNLRDDVETIDSTSLKMESNIETFKIYAHHASLVPANQNRHYPYQLAVDDCANLCVVEQNFQCQAFSICRLTGDCYLTSTHPDQNASIVEHRYSCDVYNRNYLYIYNQRPGISTLTKGGVNKAQVSSVNVCAKMCTMNTDFKCKSFEYCSSLKTCILGKLHILDIPDKQIITDPLCNVYSRRYLVDFTFTSNKEIKLKDNLIIQYLTLDQCAKACVEEENIDCASFDYCGNQTKCRLVGRDQLNTGVVTYQHSAYCDHYERETSAAYALSSVQIIKPNIAGQMAAIGISMLICGLIAGIAVSYPYIRRRLTATYN